jgi:hypothetical protein
VWPTREECPAGETPQHELPGLGAVVEDAVRARDGWRYIVEVWRSDGLLVGTYTATICAEDDQHAKCIALGQAVLDSTSAHGDRFEPGDAAAFIIEKRRANKVDGAGG